MQNLFTASDFMFDVTNQPPRKFFREFCYEGRRGSKYHKGTYAYYFTHYSQRMERIYMPRKAQGSRSAQFSDYYFIECRLDVRDKDKFAAWYKAANEDFSMYWATVLQGGYKQSCTWDMQNDTFIASITCTDQEHPNFGAVLTSRADNPVEALALTLYKYIVIFDGGQFPRDRVKSSWG